MVFRCFGNLGTVPYPHPIPAQIWVDDLDPNFPTAGGICWLPWQGILDKTPQQNKHRHVSHENNFYYFPLESWLVKNGILMSWFMK